MPLAISSIAHTTFFLALTLLHGLAFAAKCVLPLPDGGGEMPSRENLHGTIVLIRPGEVQILRKDQRRTSVAMPTAGTVFTAFGGDGDPVDLKVGQTVWVWFKNCRMPRSGLPEPAYFQIYSMDPKDRP